MDVVVDRSGQRGLAPVVAPAAHLPRRCSDSRISELPTMAKAAELRWPEIYVLVLIGIINARTEGCNRLVKSVRRTVCGFRNRKNPAHRM
ncbi:hypothetical protein ERC79_07350 [Rhodococcus sp. ABRD24]|uniref:transposase n=1 Tax=Rhodococcus sp. ABRD24 TaxID=2507582 RepID=UPI00103F7512|nr:transposase [Rhodococcus sp. ABRD24]QBJ95801.1 hypothetical protein ERC79_07350 [Rhodococcus sp. ABRD24]